jgi:23S rRNA pseudouridine1911/1915/1917 synthase
VHIVPDLKQKIRLQEYGVNIFDFCPTKSSLKKSIKKNWIRVNDEPATTATYIRGGEKIELRVQETKTEPLKLPIRVLFEDEYLAAVVKPAGIPTSGPKKRTLAKALSYNLKHSAQADAVNPHPAHRLDYETTGIVLAGKSSSSLRALSELFELRKVNKRYYAITIGEMPDRGKIDDFVDDKPAYTEFKVEDRLSSHRFDYLNLVKLLPETGRRNQLRKHLLQIGNPILGDKKFGIDGLILNGKGLFLHAYSLEFTHPVTQEKTFLECPLPNKFRKIFQSHSAELNK